jgi:hypothetical protein
MGQNRDVVPGIENHLVAPEAPVVIADNPAVLAQLNPTSIGADFHRSPAARADTEYLFLST